jgi:sensor histidine kinase YesM
VKDRWLRITGIPLIALPFPFLYHEIGTRNFYLSFIISLVTVALIWEGTRFLMLRLREKLAWNRRPMEHILAQAVLSSAYAAAVVSISIYFSYAFVYRADIAPLQIRQTAAIGVMLTLMVNAIYEGIYFSQQWRANFIRAEVLKRTGLKAQFESLTHQVNPHFLFNSLNTLATLIEESPELAKRFVTELTRLYEYVLDTRNHSVVTVEKELEFVDTYAFLLQMRFGGSLVLKNSISGKTLKTGIPPMTLQLLVENAVKHNIVSEEKPLIIRIEESGNCIVIANNIQKKTVMESSTGLGLKNIVERYRFFTEQSVEIVETGNTYTVCLPVLEITKDNLQSQRKIKSPRPDLSNAL